MSECSELLKDGVFNTMKLDSYDNLEERYYDYLMTLDEGEARSAQTDGVDLTLPSDAGPPIGLGANFTSEDFKKWKKKRETLKKTDISRTDLVHVNQTTTKPRGVKASRGFLCPLLRSKESSPNG